ncbi:uncharacterized protein LOC142335987 isoform X2 [Convolutriloba macropyga]|uniref:uncharacterized protein LOC142335987 isoform X2 n=1 Tax=Convolutriloba macropyga TaxID=536237 RepID=UPI003F5262B6
MQNFVSRCIQTINNHRNLNAIEHKSGSTNDQTTLGTDNQELSNVIGVLPPRLPNVQRKDPRPGSASRNPEMPGQVVEIDGMVSSLPTLSGSHSFPPNLTRRQMQQIINARCSSDQNINSGPKSEQGIVQSEEDILRYSAASSSTRGGSMSGRWVGLDCPEENLHTSQNGFLGGSTSSPVSAVKTKASGAVHDMNQISSCVNWVNSQTKKYIPYTVMSPPTMHATVLIGGAEPPKKSSKSKKSSIKSSIASAAASNSGPGGMKGWVVENMGRDMRDGTIFGILIEVLGGEDIEVDKSCYRLSDVSKTQEATMFQNVREILMFLEKQGVNCSGINSKDIVDGDVDSIMKLVLLIANHFRPPPEIPSQQSKPAAAFSHNQQRQHQQQQQQQQQQSQQHQHPSIMHHHQGVSTGGMTHSISAPVHFMIDPGTNQMFNQMSGGTIGNGESLKFQSPEFQASVTTSMPPFGNHSHSQPSSDNLSDSSSNKPSSMHNPNRILLAPAPFSNPPGIHNGATTPAQFVHTRQLPPHRSASYSQQSGIAMTTGVDHQARMTMGHIPRNDDLSLGESIPSVSHQQSQPERLHITKSDLATLKVTLEYLQAHESMLSHQGVVMTSTKTDSESSAKSTTEELNPRKIFTQLQEMLILSQPPDGESETGDETEASSCGGGNSSSHHTTSTNLSGKSSKQQQGANRTGGGGGNAINDTRSTPANNGSSSSNFSKGQRKRSQSQEKNAGNLINRSNTSTHESSSSSHRNSQKQTLSNNEILLNQLRTELYSSKQEWYNMQSAKNNLECRLGELESVHGNLQADYLTLQRLQGDTQTKMIEMQKRIDQQEILIIELNLNLERENERRALSMAKYQREVNELQHKLNRSLKQNNNNRDNDNSITETSESTDISRSSRRRHKSAKSPSARAKTSQRSKELQKCLSADASDNSPSTSKHFNIIGSEEYRMISSAVLDMKKNFEESDPEFQSLETIEQSLESLLGKLSGIKDGDIVRSETTAADDNDVNDSEDEEACEDNPIEVVARSKFRSRPLGSESSCNIATTSARKSIISDNSNSTFEGVSQPKAGSSNSVNNHMMNSHMTQVFYYTEGQSNPCITCIPKRFQRKTP